MREREREWGRRKNKERNTGVNIIALRRICTKVPPPWPLFTSVLNVDVVVEILSLDVSQMSVCAVLVLGAVKHRSLIVICGSVE